jgi:hypothetical protein
MDDLCQWLVEKFDGKVVHNIGPDDYIHPSILDRIDHIWASFHFQKEMLFIKTNHLG